MVRNRFVDVRVELSDSDAVYEVRDTPQQQIKIEINNGDRELEPRNQQNVKNTTTDISFLLSRMPNTFSFPT